MPRLKRACRIATLLAFSASLLVGLFFILDGKSSNSSGSSFSTKNGGSGGSDDGSSRSANTLLSRVFGTFGTFGNSALSAQERDAIDFAVAMGDAQEKNLLRRRPLPQLLRSTPALPELIFEGKKAQDHNEAEPYPQPSPAQSSQGHANAKLPHNPNFQLPSKPPHQHHNSNNNDNNNNNNNNYNANDNIVIHRNTHQLSRAVPLSSSSPLAPPRLVIHCFAFNRPRQFVRLWNSLTRAERAERMTTSIVIHVDRDNQNSSGWRTQLDLATQLSQTRNYKHGPVSAIFASENKGLRATMLEAWAPVAGEYAMFLEDDIEASPLLLRYAETMVYAYSEGGGDGGDTGAARDDNVLGFKLYNQRWDEVNQKYEDKVENGYVPFKLQEPCSWGSVFVPGPYQRYLHWYALNKHLDPYIPNAWSNTWRADRSAKKYLQRWMWEKGTYMVAVNLPDYNSLTTPRMSAGTNIRPEWLDYLRSRIEVPLLNSDSVAVMTEKGIDPYSMPPIGTLWVYDTTHSRVSQVSRPSRAEIAAISSDAHLPPAEVLDPKKLRGARWRIIDGAKKALLHDLSDPDAPLPKAPYTAPQLEAVREILIKSKRSAVPASFVERVGAKDPHLLFAFARMLYGPRFQRAMVVDAEYGLTNRLRAIGSAKAIGDATGRLLFVIWDLDAHCQARFSELFVEPRNIVFMYNAGEFMREFVEMSAMRLLFDVHDLMLPNKKHYAVDGTSSRNILVRSAFQVFSKTSYKHANILNMRLLTHRGAPAVDDLLEAYYARLDRKSADKAAKRHQNIVGVHIRMVAAVAEDTPGLTGEEAMRMELATAFRVSCHYRYFIKRMLEYPSKTHFFVSSDSPSAIAAMSKEPKLRNRIHYIDDKNGCMQRTAQCMVYAASDLLLLSRTQELLTSRWSAFSETAGKLGGMPTHDACDQPAGGWKFKGPKAVLANQIISYLRQQQYPGVDRVSKALNQFKM